MSCHKVDVECHHITSCVHLDVVDIVFVLVAAALVKVALVICVRHLHGIFDWASWVCMCDHVSTVLLPCFAKCLDKRMDRIGWVFLKDAHTIIEFLRDSRTTECERSVAGLVTRVKLAMTRDELLEIEPRHTLRGTGF